MGARFVAASLACSMFPPHPDVERNRGRHGWDGHYLILYGLVERLNPDRAGCDRLGNNSRLAVPVPVAGGLAVGSARACCCEILRFVSPIEPSGPTVGMGAAMVVN